MIILHTSSEEHDVINSFRQENNSYFLLKPIKSEELYKTLRTAVKNTEKETTVTVQPETEMSVLMQSPKVLLVDDNPVNMVLNHKMMRSLIPDSQLTEATDGLQAVLQCKEKHLTLF